MSPENVDLLQSILPMPIETDRAKVTVEELASRIRSEMVPLGTVFSYFLVLPIAEEDLKQYLEDPIAALPHAICAALPKVGIVLAPYLEKPNGKGGDLVSFEPGHLQNLAEGLQSHASREGGKLLCQRSYVLRRLFRRFLACWRIHCRP